MRKPTPNPHQEIAAPEAASEVANEKATGAAAAEPQSRKDVRENADKKVKTKYFTSRKITLLAVFVAMALVMKLIGKSLTITPTFTVTFIYLPWLLSGVVLGPIGGMIVGGVSDVLGNLVFGSPFIPLTFVSNTLFPLPIALIYKFVPIKNDYVKCSLGALCSLLLCTLGIGSLALWQYYGYYEGMSFFHYLVVFRMPQVGVFAINAGVLLALIRPLQNVGIYPAPQAAAIAPASVIFSGCALLFTALFITAMILFKPTEGNTGGTTYAAIVSIYAALLMQAGLIVAGKNKPAVITLTVGTVAALAVALVFLLVEQSDKIQFVYLLSIAAALVALVAITGAVVRIGRTRRKQHK